MRSLRMEYVCDTPEHTRWFRLETEAEAILESREMNHAVDKFYAREEEKLRERWRAARGNSLERDVGLKRHLREAMPLFLTLRNDEGEGLATAMLPPGGRADPGFDSIIVGPSNTDPFIKVGYSIHVLGEHYGLQLTRDRCYPYRRAPVLPSAAA